VLPEALAEGLQRKRRRNTNEYNYSGKDNSMGEKKPPKVFVTVNKHHYLSYNLE
jgi:hypothetical protein